MQRIHCLGDELSQLMINKASIGAIIPSWFVSYWLPITSTDMAATG